MTKPDPMAVLRIHESTVRTLRRFKPPRISWDRFLVELLDRQLDGEDIEYARGVLREFRAGVDVGIPLSSVRGAFLSPRRRMSADV